MMMVINLRSVPVMAATSRPKRCGQDAEGSRFRPDCGLFPDHFECVSIAGTLPFDALTIAYDPKVTFGTTVLDASIRSEQHRTEFHVSV